MQLATATRFYSRLALSQVMMLLLCTTALATAAPPGRAPGPAAGRTPASSPALDLTTPKKAAFAFFTAMESGDMAGMRKSSIGSDAELEIARQIGDLFQSFKRFETAMVKKFGENGRLPPELRNLTSFAARVEAYDVKVEGNVATLIDKADPTDKNPFTLRKEGANWKVALAAIDKDEVEVSKKAAKVAAAVDRVTKGVDAGKYSSPEQALVAMGQAVQQGMR